MKTITESSNRPEPATAPLSDSQIIDALGGSAAVADLCDISLPAISQWKHNGIPQARRDYLAELRPDLFPREAARKAKWKAKYRAKCKAGAA